MRVAAYCRISTDETNQPYSLDMQADKIKSYIQSQDDSWELVAHYSDKASAGDIDRPDFNRLRNDARKGRFDCVLVFKVDRVSRRMTHLCQIMDEFDDNDVVFRSITEPFDTSTSAGRMMLQMLGVFAEFERQLIRERTRAGMMRKAELGEWCGGYAPYGYDRDRENKSLKPIQFESSIVKEMYTMYSVKRMGAKAIALDLNEKGYRTRTGARWGTNSILLILRNPVYMGKIKRNNIIMNGKHDPIISDKTWQAVQTILKERGEEYSLRRSNSSEHLLSGLLRCASCGKAFVGISGNGNGGRYGYYVCGKRQKYKTCDQDNLGKEALENAIMKQLLNVLDNKDLLSRIRDEVNQIIGSKKQDKAGELAGIDQEIQRKEAVIRKYMAAFETGTMSPDQCGARINELTQEIEHLKSRKLDVDTVDEIKAYSNRELKSVRKHIKTALSNGPLPQRKAILKELIKGIIVHARNRIEATFRLPLSSVRIMNCSAPRAGLEPAT